MTRPILPLCMLAALALPGCGPAPDAADPPAAAAPPASVQPAADPPAGAAPAPGEDPDVRAAKFPADGAIGFQGFGPAAFGSGQEAVRMAWGRDLGDAVPAEPGGCYSLSPQPRPGSGKDRIAFMIVGDRFVRIDVTAPGIEAPGGGRVGMSAGGLRARYGGGLQERPHKYVDGARDLRIADPEGGEGVLLFETGADGRVDAWRIGLPPQVDWVERCG